MTRGVVFGHRMLFCSHHIDIVEWFGALIKQYIHDLADGVDFEDSFLEAAVYHTNCSFFHRGDSTATENDEPFSIPVLTLLKNWTPGASYTHSWEVDLAKQ